MNSKSIEELNVLNQQLNVSDDDKKVNDFITQVRKDVANNLAQKIVTNVEIIKDSTEIFNQNSASFETQ